jgi:phenylacetate-CoA ligase
MFLEKQARSLALKILQARDGRLRSNFHGTALRQLAAEKNENISWESSLKLKRMLLHAYDSSPYYRSIWKELAFRPDSASIPDEMQHLPFLTKEAIEQYKGAMVSDRFTVSRLETSFTGGSSGTPTSFYRDRECTTARVGRQWGILELCGYSMGARCGLVWGAHQDLPEGDEVARFKRRFRKFANGKETLSCTIMSPEKMSDFHSRLEKFRPEVLYGYPNALAYFAAFIKEERLTPIRVRTIICTAERLTREQRTVLHETFGGEVFNLYCTREHGCVAFECKRHKGLHIDVGSVYLEIVCDGRTVPEGETGEIVITDLLNRGMPFIRYKIGDRGSLSTGPCDCGCKLPLLARLDGRESDILYRTDGSVVAGLMLIDMLMDEPAVGHMQIVQENMTQIHVNLEVKNGFSSEIEKKIIRETRRFMGEEVGVNVNTVPQIPRNPNSGKFQEVICKIKLSEVTW